MTLKIGIIVVTTVTLFYLTAKLGEKIQEIKNKILPPFS